MSVHGEYERTLANLILRLRPLPPETGEPWIAAFSDLRMEHQSDLSTAARESLALLERFESDPDLPGTPDLDPQSASFDASERGPQGNILRETAAHLRSHCEAILGVTPLNRP
ncbi:MAG: hypothetical protein AB8G23_13015 [Myxococcota bacterium]